MMRPHLNLLDYPIAVAWNTVPYFWRKLTSDLPEICQNFLLFCPTPVMPTERSFKVAKISKPFLRMHLQWRSNVYNNIYKFHYNASFN